MVKKTLLPGALLGLLITLPLIGVMYLGFVVAGMPFAPYDLFDWLTRVLPGDLVTFGIDTMIDTMRLLQISVADSAKTAERISAVLLFLTGGIVAGAIFMAVLDRVKQSPVIVGSFLGVIFGLPFIVFNLIISQSDLVPLVRVLWLAVLFAAWGGAFGWAAGQLSALDRASKPAADVALPVADQAPQPAESIPSVTRLNRRQFLVRLAAGAATVTVLSAGMGAVLASRERRQLAEASPPAEIINGQRVLPNADDPVVPAPGTRPEYTPIEDHYKVFLRTEPSNIDEADWVLPIVGLVGNPLMLTLDDIRNNYESRDQFVTLSCISGRIGTSLISTTKWTGVSAQELLADAQIQDSARYLIISSEDGFYETVDLELIAQDERIMFCYAWDDRLLPKDHGFPLRIWIPDRYGMKQPKWITHIEVSDTYVPGYWVERNWDEVAQVRTTSVIDTVAVNDAFEEGGQTFVPVGGIAFSGARGISRVEVRVDGGPWQPAELRSPLSETTWVIWRYEWPFAEGDHTFEVRCAEGDGTPQIEEPMSNRPSGATGIHSFEVSG